MQFAADVGGVVHPRHAKAQFESQAGVVAECLCNGDQVLAAYLERQLVAEHHQPFDRGGEGFLAEHGDQHVDDGVEVSAVGPR